VLSDVKMPGIDGIGLLYEVRKRYPEVAVLMLTACEDISMAVTAMKSGALDYVQKPFELERVKTAVRNGLRRNAQMRRESARIRTLEQTVKQQTMELQGLLRNLEQASAGTLEALVAALDAREHEMQAHSRRVADYTVYLAQHMGVLENELETIRQGAMLHDIGKIGVPDSILLKSGPLTAEEWMQMRRHPQIGFWILNGIDQLRPAAEIVLSHHERYDGTGYPSRLSGAEIPLGARIFAVTDTLDAITSLRPYHRGQSFEAAREEIAANSQAQFDPEVVNGFLDIPAPVWSEIRNRTLADTGRKVTALPRMVLHECRLENC